LAEKEWCIRRAQLMFIIGFSHLTILFLSSKFDINAISLYEIVIKSR
jgi:hypothetical protein